MIPESVYFLQCHNCNLKFYTILHEQISKHFLTLLETGENSHLPSLSCLLQVHFCFYIHVATCLASPKPCFL